MSEKIALDCIRSKNVTLRSHQLQAVKKSIKQFGVACFFGTGAGKTLTAAAAARCANMLGLASKVLIITKLAILTQFKREMAKFWPGSSNHNGIKYQTVNSFARKPALSAKDTFLIIDEAHYMRNPKSYFTRKTLSYSSRCAKVILLTATPFVNSKVDLAPLHACLRRQRKINVKEFEDATPSKIQSFFKGLVVTFYPERSEFFPRIKYNRVVFPSARSLTPSRSASSKRDNFMVKERIQSISNKKIEYILKKMQQWKQEQKKTIIYVEFLDSGVQKMRKLLTDKNVNNAVISGKETRKKRDNIVAKYNTPSEVESKKLSRRRNLINLVDDKEMPVPEFRRIRISDKKFQYSRIGSKRPVTEDEIKKIQSLKIPPAYSPAIVMKKNKKVLYTAIAKNGKLQTKYTPDFMVQSELKKFLKLKSFNKAFFPKFDSKTKNGSQAGIVARILYKCALRPGTDASKFKTSEGHFGILSLLRKHVELNFREKSVEFKYIGKSGKLNKCKTFDSVIFSGILDRLKTIPKLSTQRIFSINSAILTNFLKEFNVTAKMFRTLFANCYFLSEISKSEKDKYENISFRKKKLSKILLEISNKLNNTPLVVKNNYLNRGLSTLYLREPAMIFKLIKNISDPVLRLQKLVNYFSRNSFDWISVLKEETTSNFTGALDVLILSGAGSESLDLKATRNVVFLTLPWTSKSYRQVIGRAARFKSHELLSKSDRNVCVTTLIETRSDKKLEKLILKKQEESTRILKALAKA